MLFRSQCSDRQTLAAFGATCVDHSTATSGFHADQKTVRTGAACFRRLISTFHDCFFADRKNLGLSQKIKDFARFAHFFSALCLSLPGVKHQIFLLRRLSVDNFLIKCSAWLPFFDLSTNPIHVILVSSIGRQRALGIG